MQKNIWILYFKPNIYTMTLTSCPVNVLLGHWAPKNFMKELECPHAQIHLPVQRRPCTSLLSTHPPGGCYSSSPAVGWGDLEPSTQLRDYQGSSGHPKSVT